MLSSSCFWMKNISVRKAIRESWSKSAFQDSLEKIKQQNTGNSNLQNNSCILTKNEYLRPEAVTKVESLYLPAHD